MNENSEASQLLRDFCSITNTRFGAKVKIIRSDNGYELTSNRMKTFYREQGIIHEPHCMDTLEQNDRVGGRHHHILNVARALRFRPIYLLNFVTNVP